MSSNHKSEGNTMKVELKYCEHCGGLWVRESGAGVYCAKCEPKVADLPIAKKSRRATLPKQERSLVQKYGAGVFDESPDLEAVGGVA